jgi:hypothetical protein
MITVASFGGGTDSTAMLIGCWQKGIKVDLILFADTGGEKPHTYEHVTQFSKWLVQHGMPAIETVRQESRKTKTLEDDCLHYKRLPSITYGFKSCSIEWKIKPVDKRLKGIEHIKLVGYEAGEERRAKDFPNNRYPLIEWGWNRAKCVEVIKNAGLPLPGKSACFFCPSSKAQEVKQLAKDYPELAARAVAMEKNAHLTDIKGLGRNYAWVDLLAFDDAQVKMFDDDWSTAEVPCGCYDGA